MILDDARVAALIAEPKPVMQVSALMPSKRAAAHRRVDREVVGARGSRFRVMVRQLVLDPLDFSVILAFQPSESTAAFRLRRHNGNSHVHPNRLEGTTVRGFHVHVATERYQLAGFKEDGYAEQTQAYQDLRGAIEYMLDVAAFAAPAQGTLPV